MQTRLRPHVQLSSLRRSCHRAPRLFHLRGRPIQPLGRAQLYRPDRLARRPPSPPPQDDVHRSARQVRHSGCTRPRFRLSPRPSMRRHSRRRVLGRATLRLCPDSGRFRLRQLPLVLFSPLFTLARVSRHSASPRRCSRARLAHSPAAHCRLHRPRRVQLFPPLWRRQRYRSMQAVPSAPLRLYGRSSSAGRFRRGRRPCRADSYLPPT